MGYLPDYLCECHWGSAHIRVEIQHKDPFLSGPGREQGGSLFQPARLFVEELLQASLLARVEAPQPEILSDSDLVSGDRCQDA